VVIVTPRISLMIRLFAYTTATTIALPASAKELWEQPWIEVRSPHFVIASALPEKRTVDLVRDLENFRKAVEMLTNIGRFEERIPTHVYVMPRGDPRFGFKNNIDGYFVPRMRANYAALEPSANVQLDDILKHEYVHFLLHNRDELNYPPWFDEGFAELLQTLTVKDNVLEYGKASTIRVSWLTSSPWLSYTKVLNTRNVFKLSQRDAAMFYAQSWALVHYLMNGRPDRRFGTDNAVYLKQIESGAKPVQAFEQAFGVPVSGLPGEVRRYLGTKLRFVRATFEQNFPVASTQVTLVPADSIAAQLAALLLLNGDVSEARRYWSAALALNPNNCTALVGLGRLLISEGHFEDAQPYYEKAIALEPGNAFHELDYAEFFLAKAATLQKDPDAMAGQLTEARRHFARSDKIDSNVPETLAMNGASYLYDGQAEKAVDSLRVAHEMLPSQPEISVLLAQAYEVADERPKAVALLRSVIAWSHSDDLAEANKLLAQWSQPDSADDADDADHESPAGADPAPPK
jgi:Flp pilus assembly protein TadD